MASGSAAAFNPVLDQRIDGQMGRTKRRPLPSGHLQENQAVLFATLLGITSVIVLSLGVNVLTAALTFLSLIGYAIVYTLWAEARDAAEHQIATRRRG